MPVQQNAQFLHNTVPSASNFTCPCSLNLWRFQRLKPSFKKETAAVLRTLDSAVDHFCTCTLQLQKLTERTQP